MSGQISHSLVAALRRVPLFADLDDHALLELVGASCNFCWGSGTTVFEKGEESEALFVVLSGSVCILDVDVDGDREIEVAKVEEGRFFGEHSLLLRQTHSKRAVAREDTELMVLSKDSFEDLLAQEPEVEAQFRRGLEERIAEAENREPPA